MLKKIIFGLAIVLTSISCLAGTTTGYGKIVGIETREWGLHIQTSFGFSHESFNCEAVVDGTYMYDFLYDNSMNSSSSASIEVSVLLAAFAASKDVAFHIYDCNVDGGRPKVGYILIR